MVQNGNTAAKALYFTYSFENNNSNLSLFYHQINCAVVCILGALFLQELANSKEKKKY